MIDLGTVADGLVRGPYGYWMTKESSGGAISYPADNSDLCFTVEESSFWFAHRNAVIAEAVRRFPPKGVFFDVGGGNGVVAKALADRDYEVALVEPSPDAAAHAVRRGLANVVCGTVDAVRFHPGTMGAIGLFDVIEHIEDDAAFLRVLRPLLITTAPVFITVPAFTSLWSVDDDAAGHFRRYRRPSLAAVLRDAGFDVMYATYFFTFLPPAIALFRALPSRLGLRRPVDEHSISREHRAGGSRGALLALLLAAEERLIARGYSLPFGASILCVARARRGREGILET